MPKCTRQLPCTEIYLQKAPCATQFLRSEYDYALKHTHENELYFKVGVSKCKGPAIIMAWCVGKDEPYRSNRFVLEGDKCKRGIWSQEVTNDRRKIEVTIKNIFVRHLTTHEESHEFVVAKLGQLEVQDRADASQNASFGQVDYDAVSTNVVRLAFQVKLKDKTVPGGWNTLQPAFSEPIYDKNNAGIDETFLSRIPDLKITEQPAKFVRFRYESERSSAGSIPGINSDNGENKTFPTVQLFLPPLSQHTYEGPVKIEIWCVTEDEPYRLHPHCLTSRNKNNCRQGGIYSVEIISEARHNMIEISFKNLGIMSMKKGNFERSLSERQEALIVNPFERDEGSKGAIDSGKVRFCFQAFLQSPGQKHFNIIVPPVVSEPIADLKRSNNIETLNIFKLCPRRGSVIGRQDIILLCNKVAKEEIQIIISDDNTGWKKTINNFIVHRQNALCFRIPPYMTTEIDRNVAVSIQLKRNNDLSNKVSFTYMPDLSTPFPSSTIDSNRTINHLLESPKKIVERNEPQNVCGMDLENEGGVLPSVTYPNGTHLNYPPVSFYDELFPENNPEYANGVHLDSGPVHDFSFLQPSLGTTVERIPQCNNDVTSIEQSIKNIDELLHANIFPTKQQSEFNFDEQLEMPMFAKPFIYPPMQIEKDDTTDTIWGIISDGYFAAAEN